MFGSRSPKDPTLRKLVIVGDATIGKTTLLTRFTRGVFYEQEFVPAFFENVVADVEIDGHQVELYLWDTAAQDDYDRLRPLSYPDTHIVLIGFSVVDPESLDHAQEKAFGFHWLKFRSTKIPTLFLITDLRDDRTTTDYLARLDKRPVSYNEGMVAGLKVGAKHYLECSSKRGDGVEEVFRAAVRLALSDDGLSASCTEDPDKVDTEGQFETKSSANLANP
ncbi:GTP-binding protein rhoA [Flagelloscypha sp. PMI_526]|nr:GTP-binding protein rhoA [Flagelloscypha sp. PMI_526]